MNSISIDFKPFIESDSNPFILFDSIGHILYLNQAAEVLLGYTSTKDVFELVLLHAPKTFGHKTTTLSLEYDSLSFYALTIGYESEEYIYIRLYHKPRLTSEKKVTTAQLTLTDINRFLEAHISFFQMESTTPIELFVDQDLPDFKIDQNQLSRILRKIFESFKESQSLYISLKLQIGEYIVIDTTKYQLIGLIFDAPTRTTINDNEIKEICEQTHNTMSIKHQSLKLEIPFIT